MRQDVSAPENRSVGLAQGKRAPLALGDPGDGLAIEGARLTLTLRPVDDQQHGQVAVGVPMPAELGPDLHSDIELFDQLPAQRVGVGLPRVDLPARQLPKASARLVQGPLLHEHPPRFLDVGGDDACYAVGHAV